MRILPWEALKLHNSNWMQMIAGNQFYFWVFLFQKNCLPWGPQFEWTWWGQCALTLNSRYRLRHRQSPATPTSHVQILKSRLMYASIVTLFTHAASKLATPNFYPPESLGKTIICRSLTGLSWHVMVRRAVYKKTDNEAHDVKKPNVLWQDNRAPTTLRWLLQSSNSKKSPEIP